MVTCGAVSATTLTRSGRRWCTSWRTGSRRLRGSALTPGCRYHPPGPRAEGGREGARGLTEAALCVCVCCVWYQSVRLYFADWGYSTPEQRMRALYNPRVTVLDLADFSCMCRLLDPNRQDGYPCFVPTCKDKRLSPERFSFIPPPPGAAPSTDNRQQAGEGAAAAVEQEEGGGEASLSCEEAGGPRGQQAAVEEEEAEEEGSSEEEGRASP